jgi:hypothetical protein
MGAVLEPAPGESLSFDVRAADAAGIASVRIVSQGRAVKTFDAGGQPTFEAVWRRKATAKPVYYRLETVAVDDLRAYSTPIYVRPAKKKGRG